jgi:hypothetical protein
VREGDRSRNAGPELVLRRQLSGREVPDADAIGGVDALLVADGREPLAVRREREARSAPLLRQLECRCASARTQDPDPGRGDAEDEERSVR